ncbi:MAG: stage II sporulation protein M [Candidatus Altiarchaeota archaeon]|nr:stage II sporulation protein M [Candidatus Altiarchaeota archaeon]
MLESIISPKTAERNPWDMLVLGVIVSSLAIWLGFYLSNSLKANPSILILALIVVALAPLIHRILSMEEEKDERIVREEEIEETLIEKKIIDGECVHKERKYFTSFFTSFFSRHSDVILLYCFLFLGLMISFSFWFTVLPMETAENLPSSGIVFQEQTGAIKAIAKSFQSGKAVGDDECIPKEQESMARWGKFERIYDNNIGVMIVCFGASFLFGAGALWIISWNASVVAVFIGQKIKEELSNLPALHAYFTGFPKYSLGIALWGIPEIAAYLVAGIAGGIVGVAIAKHRFRSECFWFTVYDGALLMLFAIFLVFLGAWIEHFYVSINICK